MTINHQPLKKAQWVLNIFQISTDFIKHFLKNPIEGLNNLKEKSCQNTKVIRKSPQKMPSQKLFGPIVC